MLNTFLTLVACHFLADFPFQSDWLASNKGKSWELMIYHCLIYTATFILFAKVSLAFAAILFITHMIIDPLKARYHVVKQIWQDQLLHMVVLVAGVIFGL
jgi:hypothetical protein